MYNSALALARLFEGNSSRGGINSTCIDCWINTFEYMRENPDHIDTEAPKPFNMKPTKEYFELVEKISEVIPDNIIKSWDTLSNKKLGLEVEKYCYSNGTKNATAVKTIHQRVKDMIERRRNNIWNKTFDMKQKLNDGGDLGSNPITSFNKENNNYNMMNVPELRALCKERNLANAHLKLKHEIVKLLEDNPDNLQKIIVMQRKEIKELKERIKQLEQQYQ